MASDLSKLIQDSFTLTLNGLLAKDAKILSITKAHPYDIEDMQLLLVQSTFEFTNITSKFSYLVPAKSASLIFNTMMGSPITELAEEFDDDSEDAISEFVSNTCGGLTTAINALGFDDLGQTKFNISHKEILEGKSLLDLETTFRFEIDLEDHELILFMSFEEEILTHIEEIMASKITFHEERKEQEAEEVKEEVIQEEIKEAPKATEEKMEKTKEEISNDIIEKEVTPKDKKIKLLIMIVGGFTGLLILSFLVLYFIGVFDEDPIIEPVLDTNTTKIIVDPNQINVVKYQTLKKVNFKSSQIDKNRLNAKLEELTKYKVLNKEELEAQKLEEKNRLFELEKEKELIAFSKKNQEEPIFEKKELEKKIIVDKKTKFKKETFTVEKNKVIVQENPVKVKDAISPTVKKEMISKNFYVVTNSLKYRLFKTLVQETKTSQARISICNNKSGKTTIYIGPFENEELQTQMIQLTSSQDKNIVMQAQEITEKEFSTRCNLE